jgi:hypothetical protein
MSILDLQGLEATASEPELAWNSGPSTLSVVNCGTSTVSTILCL